MRNMSKSAHLYKFVLLIRGGDYQTSQEFRNLLCHGAKFKHLHIVLCLEHIVFDPSNMEIYSSESTLPMRMQYDGAQSLYWLHLNLKGKKKQKELQQSTWNIVHDVATRQF